MDFEIKLYLNIMPPKNKNSNTNNTRSLRSRIGASVSDSQSTSATPPRNQQTPLSHTDQHLSFSTPTPEQESAGMLIVNELIKKARLRIFKKVN